RTGTRAPTPAAMAASTVRPRPRGRGSLATPLAVRRAVCFARVSAGLRAPDADHGPVLLLAVASRVVGPSAMTAIVSATAAGQRRHWTWSAPASLSKPTGWLAPTDTT